MGDKRKLQADVDRCIKKVNEGKSNLEELKIKMNSAQNSNQRERFESDMKKEIKRLQRVREQIKVWLGHSDIKDKTTLNAARRTIEEQMESFKLIEKEAKTKAYSRDGLISAVKKDPTQIRREEFGVWVNEIFSTLRRQIEEYEAEIEGMVNMKSKKASRDGSKLLSVLERKISEHNNHIASLEKVLRLVDNESLELSEAEEIRDDVDYYLDYHGQENFIKNDDIYSKLGLDRVLVSNTPQLITEVVNQPSKSEPVKYKRTVIEKTNLKPENIKMSPMDSSVSPIESKPWEIVDKHQSVSPVVEIVFPPAPSLDKKESNIFPETSAATVKTPAILHSTLKVVPENKVEVKDVASTSIEKESVTKITEKNINGEPLKIVSEAGTVTPLNPPLKPAVAISKISSTSSSSVMDDYNDDFMEENHSACQIQDSHHMKNDLFERIMNQDNLREHIIQNNNDVINEHSNFIWNCSLKHTRHIDEESILEEFDSFNEHYSKMKSSYVLRKEHSQHNSLSSLPVKIPEYHNLPTRQLFMYPEYFNCLSMNVLFFIFYNYQGTCAQCNAAKTIKSRYWRYHRGLKLWFIRQCEPRHMTMEYEQGNYYYFDTEKWQKIYIQDFRFEFEYLEDKLLV